MIVVSQSADKNVMQNLPEVRELPISQRELHYILREDVMRIYRDDE